MDSKGLMWTKRDKSFRLTRFQVKATPTHEDLSGPNFRCRYRLGYRRYQEKEGPGWGRIEGANVVKCSSDGETFERTSRISNKAGHRLQRPCPRCDTGQDYRRPSSYTLPSFMRDPVLPRIGSLFHCYSAGNALVDCFVTGR